MKKVDILNSSDNKYREGKIVSEYAITNIPKISKIYIDNIMFFCNNYPKDD